MPSFDIVSKVDLSEIDNALNNMMREISQRYDFKGSQSRADHEDGVITLFADDDMKLRQLHEMLQGHLSKRGIEPGALDYGSVESAAGQSVRQKVTVMQGIARDLAKTLTKAVKDSKLKVQVQIQGDELRVTGKKRDDLQAAITQLKEASFGLPLQYQNFRD